MFTLFPRDLYTLRQGVKTACSGLPRICPGRLGSPGTRCSYLSEVERDESVRGRGMKRCRNHGRARFEVFVGGAVLANNLLRIADLIRNSCSHKKKAA